MKKNKAIFLDRDGVINIDFGYVYKIEDFEFVEGIFEVLRRFQDAGFKLFIITNQSGIGRGYYTEEDFLILNEYMLKEFNKRGIKILKVFYCPHLPEDNCDCRKPSPKFIFDAEKEFNLSLKNSFVIGDKETDILAGKNAGCKTSRVKKNESLLFHPEIITKLN